MNNHSQQPDVKGFARLNGEGEVTGVHRISGSENPWQDSQYPSVDSQNCRGNTLEVENRGCSIRNTRSGFYTDFCGTETHNKTKGKCRIAVGGSK